MRRFTKIALVAFGVVVAVLAAAVIWLATVDFNDYKDVVAAEVRAMTGRTLAIDGDLKVRISLAPAVRATGLSLSNPGWAKRPRMAEIESLDAQVEILPLLTGDVRFKRLVLDGVKVALERNAAGRGNWELQRPAAEKSDARSETDETDDIMDALRGVSRFQVRNATVDLAALGGAGMRRIALEQLDATRRGGTLDIDGRAVVAREFVGIAGTIGPIARKAGSRDATVPFKLRTAALGDVFTAEGALRRRNQGTAVDAAITAAGDEIAATAGRLRALLEDRQPATGAKVGPYRFSANARIAAGRIALTGILAKIGARSDISGRVAIVLSRRIPRVDAALISGTLDIDALMPLVRSGSADAAAPAADEKRVISAAPLPFDALKSIEGKIRLDIGKALVRGAPKVELASVAASLGGGRVDLRPLSARVAGGSVEGSIGIDLRARAPVTTIALTTKGVVLGDLMKSVDDSRLLSGGKTDAEIRLTGTGATPRALVATLSGTVTARIGEGRIDNKLLDVVAGDIAGELISAINPLKKKERFSRLKCGVARAWFGEGLMHVPASVAFETEKASLMASGDADLKDEKLDFALRPEARGGLGVGIGGTAGQLARLRGTFKEPSIGVDELGAAKTAAKIGAAVATTGLSLLAEKLIDKATRSGSPCKAALEAKLEAPPKNIAEGAQRSVEKSAKDVGAVVEGAGKGVVKGAEGVGNVVEGAGKGVVKGAKKLGEGIRSLFDKSK